MARLHPFTAPCSPSGTLPPPLDGGHRTISRGDPWLPVRRVDRAQGRAVTLAVRADGLGVGGGSSFPCPPLLTRRLPCLPWTWLSRTLDSCSGMLSHQSLLLHDSRSPSPCRARTLTSACAQSRGDEATRLLSQPRGLCPDPAGPQLPLPVHPVAAGSSLSPPRCLATPGLDRPGEAGPVCGQISAFAPLCSSRHLPSEMNRSSPGCSPSRAKPVFPDRPGLIPGPPAAEPSCGRQPGAGTCRQPGDRPWPASCTPSTGSERPRHRAAARLVHAVALATRQVLLHLAPWVSPQTGVCSPGPQRTSAGRAQAGAPQLRGHQLPETVP